MATRKIPGLFKIGEIWHIDKTINGQRINKSTGTRDLTEAQLVMSRIIEGVRQANVFGVRAKRRFSEAIERYVRENQDLASISDNEQHLRKILSVIGDRYLHEIFEETVQPFIEVRRAEGRKSKTVNNALGVLRRVLKLAAGKWRNQNGLTWLESFPDIDDVNWHDARQPYPLSYAEQVKLLDVMPVHLRAMFLFKVNTGCREQEVCQLRWEWEFDLTNSDDIVFQLPAWLTKNREERLVVINKEARQAIESVRGQHPEFVFTYRGRPVKNMNSTAWRNARKKTDLKCARLHDAKHTFGRRLRAADVHFEDRQDLLGHKNGSITTHYSEAEIKNLIDASNKICQEDENSRKIHEAVVLIRKKVT